MAVTAPAVNRTTFQAAKQPSSAQIMWHSADVGTTIATGVSQWNDRTGFLNHMLQATGASQPALSANGSNVGTQCVTSDGVDDMMSLAGNVSYGPFTRVVVHKGTAAGMVAEHLSAADNDFLYSNAAGPNAQADRGGVNSTRTLTATTTWGSDATWRTIVQRFDGSNAGHRLELAGVEPANTNGSAGNGGGGASNNPYNLFGRVSGALFMGGSIAEHMVWSKSLHEHDMARVRAYEKGRYGL